MTSGERNVASMIEWGTAGMPIPGEVESGDLHVVAPFADGVLVALIDGLGHGPDAAEAARVAATLLAAHANETPISLLQRCHEGLRKTRGVVMSVASLDVRDSSLTWLGVGNVEGVLLRADPESTSEAIALRGGVVGYQMPPLRAEVLPIGRGDTLILATDGIRSDFKLGVALEAASQAIAESILARCAKTSDDATVLVARYLAARQVLVPIRDPSDVVMARKRLRDVAYQVGFQETAVETLAIAVTEVASNILLHARSGELRMALVEDRDRLGLEVVAVDEGPGIADVERAVEDHYSTGGGLGLGLSSAKRLVDEFKLSSTVGQGTVVTLRKWRT
jgi:phosphoserine phosphatase RsbX